jgi:predicted ABC-type transport system involved in lysophospholipase L1 biosynthesis ATPase subunit
VLDIVFDYVESSDATLVCVTHDQSLLGRFEQVVDFAEYRTEGSDA